MPLAQTLKLALRFSLREMRGGLSGFLIFLACIALGVAAIGGVNSVARSITAGVANAGPGAARRRYALRAQPARGDAGGARLPRRPRRGVATAPACARWRGWRTVPTRRWSRSRRSTTPIRSMARWRPSRRCRSEDLFGERDGVFGAAAPDLLFERLGLKLGDRIKLGSATFELRARLVTEPDAISDGFGFAPRLMISTGRACARPAWSSPAAWSSMPTRSACPPAPSEARIADIRDAGRRRISRRPAGRSARAATRRRRCPSNIERFSQFLTLVGLTALVVGGVGVANAVRAYLDGKRGVIATFKSLGASGGFVFAVYLVQILIIAGDRHRARPGARRADAVRGERRAVVGHSGAGAKAASIPARWRMAALFGLLVTLAFALLPLGRARDVPATALFREMGFGGRGLPRLAYVAAALGIALLLAALAIWFSGDRRIAAIFVGATIVRLPRAARRRHRWCNGWRAAQPARALDGAAARHRQHPSARRADAIGRAVARARPDAAGDAGADRRQSAPADLPAACRSGRRTSSSSTSRAAMSTRFADAGRQAGAGGQAGRGADAARPHHGAERRRRRRRSRCRRRAPGCCAATAA